MDVSLLPIYEASNSRIDATMPSFEEVFLVLATMCRISWNLVHMWRFRFIVTLFFWVRLGTTKNLKTRPGNGCRVPGFPIPACHERPWVRAVPSPIQTWRVNVASYRRFGKVWHVQLSQCHTFELGDISRFLSHGKYFFYFFKQSPKCRKTIEMQQIS